MCWFFRKSRKEARGTGVNENILSKVVTLPSYEEIMARLRELEIGAPGHLEKNFFPLLAKKGGQSLEAREISTILKDKIKEFKPIENNPALTDLLLSRVRRHVPEIIEALVLDKQIAIEVTRYYQVLMKN